MARQGLNATLSYLHGTQRRAYRVRANLLTFGMKVIFDESQARVRKAFYPHRLSSAQFALGVQLKGEAEYVSFSSWMATYADYVLNPNLRRGEFPSMAVSVPSRGFLRKGVPLSGYEWGDRVGGMVWSPQIVFETSEEPVDRHKMVQLSKVAGLGATTNRVTKYFYPTANRSQLNGNEAPPDGTYAKPIDVHDILGVQPSYDSAEGVQSAGEMF